MFSIGNWLIVLVIIWLLGFIGLGWLVNFILILFGFILIVFIVLFFGFCWWLNCNLIMDKCFICSYEFIVLN